MPATSLEVRPGLHHCCVRGRTIFLDVPANRYFALPAVLDKAFQGVVDAGGASPDSAAVSRLQALGILMPATMSAGTSRRPDKLPSPGSRTAIGTISPGWTSAEFLARYIGAIAELRLSSLERVLARRLVRAVRRRASEPGRRDVGDVVAAVFRIDRVLSAYRRCLPRSIAIFDMLVARGLAPQIVIGVSQTAFSGHCWIQDNDTVIGDHADVVQLYTPILAI